MASLALFWSLIGKFEHIQLIAQFTDFHNFYLTRDLFTGKNTQIHVQIKSTIQR